MYYILRPIAIRNLVFANSHSKNCGQYHWILYFIPFERSISYLETFYHFDFHLFWKILRDPNCYIYQNNDKSSSMQFLNYESKSITVFDAVYFCSCVTLNVNITTQTFRDYHHLFEQCSTEIVWSIISSFASLFVCWCFSFYYYLPQNDMYCGALVIITNEC